MKENIISNAMVCVKFLIHNGPAWELRPSSGTYIDWDDDDDDASQTFIFTKWCFRDFFVYDVPKTKETKLFLATIYILDSTAKFTPRWVLFISAPVPQAKMLGSL